MISIIIGTFGEGWVENNRQYWNLARLSALGQTRNDIEVIMSHRDTLHEARNDGALHAKGSRLVFLDADDYLDDDFCELITETEDVLQPRTRYFYENGMRSEPKYLPAFDDLLEGNHLIVGCPVKRELFMDVGGFDDWPIYEDWALWLKIRKAGGTFGTTKGIYNIRVRPGSRNQGYVGDTFGKIRATYA